MYFLVLITLLIVTISTVGLISGSLTFNQSTRYSTEKTQAVNLAEAGIDKAVASLNKSGSYNGEIETILGPGSYEVAITDVDSSTKLIKSTGYIPNKTNPKSKKVIQLRISKGVGVSFNYGMQIGEGGMQMGNTSNFTGSIYSNGNITGGNGNIFTGDVYVAGGVQPTADAWHDCSSPNCAEFIFGKNVSGNNQYDVAQSFVPQTTEVINKMALKLKKNGSPPNIPIRILGNNDNGTSSNPADDFPDKNDVKTSGTLNASLVSNVSFGFIEVGFSTNPTLNAGTKYWIMADSSNDTSNYWYWQGDLLLGYADGITKWSQNWNTGNPAWNNPSPQIDLGFKTYMGGVATSINLGNGSTISGDAHANTITGGNMTVSGNAYYQTLGSSVTVNGTKYPGSVDPAPTVFPVSDSNILDWKNQAAEGTIYSSQNGCNLTFESGKINGNLTIGNGCSVTLKSPLWITGNVVAGNSAKFKLDSSAGSSSGVIIVDGTVVLGNGCEDGTCGLTGSGISGSYLMLLSTYDSRTSGADAMTSGNSTFSGIFYLPTGIMNIGNTATFKEVVAWKIILGNSATLSYDTGVANAFFSSGPSGSYSVIKGSYQSN